LRAGCKINLYLRVGQKLPDGYHEIETLFVPLLKPYDIIEIFSQDSKVCAPSGAIADSPCGQKNPQVEFSVPGINAERNTLTKAHAWYGSITGFAPALTIRVRKNIPHGAGLGGGSSDAAALLRYLQREAAKAGYTPLDRAELLKKSAAVGADVPFFLVGAAAKAAGIGEKLTPVPMPYPGCTLVLACPDIAVSTAWAFGALDAARENTPAASAGNADRREDAAGSCPFCPAGGPAEAGNAATPRREKKAEKNQSGGLTLRRRQATYFPPYESFPGNDFENLVLGHLPRLADLHARLRGTKAKLVRMSGTGSSIFAIFRNAAEARDIVKRLAEEGCKVYTQVL
jgi:4-diphosphocytidyl-2-C-methyl-D-erythritol kinase